MKKYFLILFVLGAIAFASSAIADSSYLYWMVDDSANVDVSEYDSVKVCAIDSSNPSSQNYLTLYRSAEGDLYSYGSSIAGETVGAAGEAGLGFYASLATYMGNNYSYVIELYNNDKFVAQSEALTSASASSYTATIGGGSGLQELVTAWSPTTFSVPEPNSALLMALGSAALALRRRRQLKA